MKPVADMSYILDFIGITLSVVGIAISLCGFWLALRQLRKTNSATQASIDTMKRVASKVESYDLILESSNIGVRCRDCIDRLSSLSAGQLSTELWGIHKKFEKLNDFVTDPARQKEVFDSKVNLFQLITITDEVNFDEHRQIDFRPVTGCLREIMRLVERVSLDAQKDRFNV